MNVEEALIDLGDKPLHKSRYSRVLKAMLTALVPTDQEISMNHTGDELLTMIYKTNGVSLQDKILQKQVGTMRNSDTYRSTVLSASVLIGVSVVLIALFEMNGISIFSWFKQ